MIFRKKKKKLRGNIYIINDSLVSRDRYSKANRRVVAVNNNPNKLRIVKIKSLYDSNGKKRKGLIPIKIYPCMYKRSGIDKHVYYKTSKNKPIQETKMKKTRYRLNKRDMKRIKNIY